MRRALQGLELLGRPLPQDSAARLAAAIKERTDAAAIQTLLDPHVLLAVAINPESRVKVLRGPAAATSSRAATRPCSSR